MKPQIFQIYYRDDQKSFLEKDFIPYDNVANPRPEWCEYFVFRDNFKKGVCSTEKPTGFLSWKFHNKTGLDGQAFINFVEANPGYDVYFINPFVDEAAFYLNPWIQGDRNHPGLIELTDRVLKRVGYNVDLKTLVIPFEKTLYCNYFVGNETFWQAYMKFCEPIYNEIETSLDAETKKFLSQRADQRIQADYRPFIFERLFSTFLTLNPDIRSKNFEWTDCKLNARYQSQAKYIHQLAQLKRESNLGEFYRVSAEALAQSAYGPNAHWLKKQIRNQLRFDRIKNPFLRKTAQHILNLVRGRANG